MKKKRKRVQVYFKKKSLRYDAHRKEKKDNDTEKENKQKEYTFADYQKMSTLFKKNAK